MKKKNLLMTSIAIFGLALFTNAQVPNYIPTNGLVGWWPFNGNANDESSNGNDGTVIGATLTNDRFGNESKAYSFDGVDDFISAQCNNLPLNNSSRSFSAYINYQPLQGHSAWSSIISYGLVTGQFPGDPGTLNDVLIGESNFDEIYLNNHQYGTIAQSSVALNNAWHHIVVTYDSTSLNNINIYIDGTLYTQPYIFNYNNITQLSTLLTDLTFGKTSSNYGPNSYSLKGILDDIGIWNRALTQEEISNLYNATNCSNNLTVSPATSQLQTGSNANFIATTSDPNPSYVWQSDLGQGFQTLNNYGNYSGVNTNSLSISNVQLPNHTQPIRVISTSGECIDTSNVATINIIDTCIVTINDTITTLISVTDTLVINTLITGLTPPNNSNTIKVYPNPANSHITIDFGNFESMNGYTLTITNSIGQTVYTTPINEQSSYIDLSTWSGNGIYFVQIIDTLNNTIVNRKIVLQ
jgi:hypothetical protein